MSVHDLMPRTMPAVRRILDLLERRAIAPVTLLVVPGSGWDTRGISDLKALQRDGWRLAGHGWRHRADTIQGAYHRLHSLLLSRDVAEHLALDTDGIAAMLQRCHAWFGDNGLDPPLLYVPPAWAMGRISRARLVENGPFTLYEYFSGIFDAHHATDHPMPMIGYEANDSLRLAAIRAWNTLGRRRAARFGLLRLGIHPFDLDLPMADDLRGDLARCTHPIDYTEIPRRGGQ